MKFRTFLMSAALLAAVSVSFAFKPRPFGTLASIKIGTSCTTATGLYTNEPVCAPSGTGPQCTVTYVGQSYLAWQRATTPACSVALYVVNP